MIFSSEILKWITLEPAIFLLFCGQHLVKGSKLQEYLLIWKICRLELNYPEEVCANITNDEFEDINDEVQKRANNFFKRKIFKERNDEQERNDERERNE